MRKASKGFSLLEAIIALVILSMVLLATFSWFDRGIQALIKIDDLSLEESAVQEVIARLRLEDFTEQQNGTYRWLDYRAEWKANLTESPREGRNNVGSQGYFDLSLYRISLELYYDDRLIASPILHLLEEELVRQPPDS